MAKKKAVEAEEKSCSCCGGRCRKCCRRMLCIALVAGAIVWYSKQDESKKRFLKHLGKQLPYLPARYYA